jgi:hypothetical protein
MLLTPDDLSEGASSGWEKPDPSPRLGERSGSSVAFPIRPFRSMMLALGIDVGRSLSAPTE